MTNTPTRQNRDKKNLIIIGLLSAVTLVGLVWLIYFGPKDSSGYSQEFIEFLPVLNVSLNSLASLFLIAGFIFIKKKKEIMHRNMMVSAFVASSLFLVSYLIYHYAHGDTKFINVGFIKYSYFFILISHIILSGVVLPLIFTTFYYILTNNRAKHKKFAMITFPIWLYVSVTGVLVFFYLRYFNLQ
jgi:putative membrane protein